MRRFLRIWPLYLAYLLLIFVIVYYLSPTDSDDYFRLITLVTFTDNIATAVYGYNPFIATAHLWTISYEEQLYLTLPVVVLLTFRLSRPANNILLIILISIGLLARLLFILWGMPHPAIWVLPLTHFESVIAGFLLALFYPNIRSIPVWPTLATGVISILVVITLPPSNVINHHLHFLYACVAILCLSTMILILNCSFQWLNRILLLKPFRYLGKISYGLYIFHVLSLTAVYHCKPSGNYFVNGILAFFLCVFVSAVSFEFFEKRFLELKRQYKVNRN